jgi:hypothetical protein
VIAAGSLLQQSRGWKEGQSVEARACHLIEPDEGSSEVDSSEEVIGCFIVASGDATEELEFGEEVLDQVSSFVEFLVILSLHFSIGFRRDGGFFPASFNGSNTLLSASKALSAITVLASSRGSSTSAPSSSQAWPSVR